MKEKPILETGLDEVQKITDPRKTLEVQFYDEVSFNTIYARLNNETYYVMGSGVRLSVNFFVSG